MRQTMTLLSTLAAACVGAVPARAQIAPPLAAQPGPRVRVTRCDGARCLQVIGDLLEFGPDTVRIGLSDGSTVALRRSETQRIQEAAGTHGHALAGLAIGGGLGLGLGVLVGVSLSAPEVECSDCAPVFIGAGTVAGALLGLLVGAAIRTERWIDVPADQLALVPVWAPARVGVALRIPIRVALRH